MRIRAVVLDMLKSVGFDKTKYGLYGLRSVCCTAADIFGIINYWTDCLLKRHDNSPSERAKDGFVKYNIDNVLSVLS